MKITLKLKKQNKNSKGEYPLFIRIRKTRIDNNKVEEVALSTNIFLLPKHFKGGNISQSAPNYLAKQKTISTMYQDLENIIAGIKEEGKIPIPSYVKKRYLEAEALKEMTTPKVQSFWKTYDEFMETKKHKSKGYIATLTTLKNRLKEYEEHKGISLTFDYIISRTIAFQSQLQDYFWTDKNLTNGYINKLLNNLALFLHYAFENGYVEKKPRFKRNETVEIDEKVYLYQSEIKKLFSSNKWDYEEGKDYDNPHLYLINQELIGKRAKKWNYLLTVTNWELVKDIFLFQCTTGCRYSDILHFKIEYLDFEKKKETRFFTYRQQKTNKLVVVPATNISNELFRKYSRGKSLTCNLFPPLSNQKFNKQLKLLLKDLHFNRLVSRPRKMGNKIVSGEEKFLWELISSHSGRRTYIKGLIDLGLDYKTIMTMSGHKTYKNFEKYISVSSSDIAKGSKLFEMDDIKTQDIVKDLLKHFINLTDSNRDIVIRMVKSLSEKS